MSNRSQYLQNEMVSRYADLTDTSTAINAIVANTLGDQTTADLGRDAGLDERTLAALNGELLKVIRRNAVSGAFVVLTGDDHTYTLAPAKTRALSALYLRTSEPGSTSLDLANFSVVRAPKAIATSLSDISVDSNWNPKLTLKGDDPGSSTFRLLLSRGFPMCHQSFVRILHQRTRLCQSRGQYPKTPIEHHGRKRQHLPPHQ